MSFNAIRETIITKISEFTVLYLLHMCSINVCEQLSKQSQTPDFWSDKYIYLTMQYLFVSCVVLKKSGT